MKRSFCLPTSALFLGLLLLASCRTMHNADAGSLPRLRAGAALSAPTARLTGVLTGDASCLRVGGNGNTVVIWPLAANARGTPGNGNVVVIWPRSAIVQQGGGSGVAGINVIVVWPRAIGVGTPVRVGAPIELVGDMKDDISGLALDRPLPPGCTGRAFVAREFRPAPDGGGAGGPLYFPQLRPGMAAPAPTTRRTGRLVRDGPLLRLDGGGGGTVIVIWPFSATLQQGEGGGSTVIIWPRTIGSGTPIRVGDRVVLSGIITADNVSGRVANCPPEGGCAGPLFLVSEFGPAPDSR